MFKTSLIKSSFQRIKLNNANKNNLHKLTAFKWNKICAFLVHFLLPFAFEMRFLGKWKCEFWLMSEISGLSKIEFVFEFQCVYEFRFVSKFWCFWVQMRVRVPMRIQVPMQVRVPMRIQVWVRVFLRSLSLQIREYKPSCPSSTYHPPSFSFIIFMKMLIFLLCCSL